MKNMVTHLIPIRNRDVSLVTRQVRSIRDSGDSPEIVLIDSGSDGSHSDSYREAASREGFLYEKLYTEGWPWNKCHALNYGARIARTPLIATSDADIYFNKSPYKEAVGFAVGKRIVQVPSYWLPKSGDEQKAMSAGRGSPGMFQLIGRDAFEATGGYDERFNFWSTDDLDWLERLKLLGYEQVWLEGDLKVYHQWHAASSTGGLRPITASYVTMACCLENKINPVLRQAQGKAVRIQDRPILQEMERPVLSRIVDIKANAFMHYGNIDLILDTKLIGGFVRLNIGERQIQRPLSKFKNLAKALIRPFSALTGTSVIDKLNCNIDYLYAFLPTLQKNGLTDYFIHNDFKTVDLLWETA